jgi:hypothetical protein
MSEVAKLRLPDNRELDLPVVTGTEQERGLDISKLLAAGGVVTLDEGFEAILLRNKCQVRLHHVNYCHDSLYNPLSHSSHCSNWVTYVVRATGFFQDTKYFLQLPVVCG